MLVTHFLKTLPKNDALLASPLESLIYNILSDVKLYTEEDILASLDAHLDLHKSEAFGLPKGNLNRKGGIKTLTQKGFLKEIHGIRLEKLLKNI